MTFKYSHDEQERREPKLIFLAHTSSPCTQILAWLSIRFSMLPNLTNQYISYSMAVFSANEIRTFKGEYLKPDNIITYCYSPIIEIQIQYLLRVWLHKLASSSIISSYLHPQFLKAQFCFVMTRESRCSSSTEKRPWCLEVACGCQLVQLVMLPSLSWW